MGAVEFGRADEAEAVVRADSIEDALARARVELDRYYGEQAYAILSTSAEMMNMPGEGRWRVTVKAST